MCHCFHNVLTLGIYNFTTKTYLQIHPSSTPHYHTSKEHHPHPLSPPARRPSPSPTSTPLTIPPHLSQTHETNLTQAHIPHNPSTLLYPLSHFPLTSPLFILTTKNNKKIGISKQSKRPPSPPKAQNLNIHFSLLTRFYVYVLRINRSIPLRDHFNLTQLTN